MKIIIVFLFADFAEQDLKFENLLIEKRKFLFKYIFKFLFFLLDCHVLALLVNLYFKKLGAIF